MAELPPRPEGIALCHFIVSDDVERSRRFYTEVLGGRLAFSGPGGLTYVALSNSWIIINVGGGPTDDKPAVRLETPWDPHRVSSFLNIRVKDIEAVYAEHSAAQTAHYKDICRAHGLVATGGSDYHGPHTGRASTPGTPHVPLEVWHELKARAERA